MIMRSAVIVASAEAQATRKLLESHGLWDQTRRLQKHEGDKVAIPVNTLDSKVLASLLSKGTTDVCVMDLYLPPTKKELLQTPAHRLKQMSCHLLDKNGVTSVDRDLMLKEVPDHWEKHGDLILLPASAYVSPIWASLGEELWLTVAKCLCGKRVARQAVVKTDGFRSPQVRLLLGDSGTVQHLDNGIRYEYDVTRCMFSAGNITEKMRIAGFKCQGETVVDLYAGIGYFTLPYLVHGGADHVHACEWNPDAVAALTHNLRLNGVEHRCTVHPGDNQKLPLVGIADRVNLGLIPSSQAGWPVACRVLKAKGGVLHVHGNVNSRTGVGEALKACQTQGDSEDIFKCSEDSLRASACVTSYMQSDSEDRVSASEQCEENLASGCGENKCQQGEVGCTEKTKALHSDCTLKSHHQTDSAGIKERRISEMDTDKSTRLHAWEHWGKQVCATLHQLLEQQHGGRWKSIVQHIEHVKSYAPHVDHIVLDIHCCPVALSKTQ